MQLAHSAAAWRDAWRGRHDNPLLTTWPAAEARRRASLPWLRRSPGLTVLGALLALWATAANVFLLAQLVALPVVTPRHAFAFIAGGAVQLLLCAVAFGTCWYLARLFGVMQAALGFLNAAQLRRQDAALDDPLLLTQLTPADLLLGCVLHGLRRLGVPLALLTVLIVLNDARLVAAQYLDVGAAVPLGLLAVHAAQLALMLVASALLTVPALVLLGIALSGGRYAQLSPSLGAGLLVCLQPLLGFLSAGASTTISKAHLVVSTVGYFALGLGGLLGLLLAGARWSSPRAVLRVAGPLLWTGWLAFAGNYIGDRLGWGKVGQLSGLTPAGLLTPLDAMPWLFRWFDADEPPHPVIWLVMLGARVLLLGASGWFALRALRARQRGDE